MLTNLKIFLKFLGRNKVYTAVTVAGFGVSLMFVVVLGLYVRQELSVDKFHENGDRIYMAVNNLNDEPRGSHFANPVGPWMAENYPDVEAFVRMTDWEGEIERPDGEVTEANVTLADSTFFNVFSFQLRDGDPSQVLARPASAVLSPAMAGSLFGDADPVGGTVRFEGVDFTVTGVFEDFPTNTIFTAPDMIIDYGRLNQLRGDNTLNNYSNSGWPLFVLERERGDIRRHSADMISKFKEFWWVFQDGFSNELDFVPLKDVYFGGVTAYGMDMRSNSLTGVMLYLGIALLILVVALLNYVNMTVAQAGFRGREVALKKLHGASRGMVISQLLFESLVMTVISFGVGLVLAFALEPFFNGVLNTKLSLATAFTLPVVAAIAGLIVVLAVVSGIVPALVMSRFKPIEIVKGSFSRRVKGVYSRVLAVFQYTVSIVLLICSAMIVLQSRYLATRDVGLRRDGVMLINAEGVKGMNNERYKTAQALIADVPGVEVVSRMQRNPFDSWGGNNSFEYNGKAHSFELFRVDSMFFRLFGVTYEPTGADLTSQNPTWFNRPGYNALRPDETDNVIIIPGNSQPLTAVGILSDFNFRPLNEAQGLLMLRQMDDFWSPFYAVRIAAGNDLSETAERVRAAFASFVGNDRFIWEWADDTVYEFYEQERRTSRIMAAFTVLVMLIMFMGIFAMSIYILRQKEKEIAIRKVNGSRVGEILALLSRQSVISVAIAFVVAVPVSWWTMTRWLQSFPYRVDITPWPFVAAGALVLLLSFLCVGWQSYRAATANPVESLKGE